MREVLTTLITALIGGGGVLFVRAVISGWGSLRAGARAGEREAIADLARSRDDADERCRSAEIDRDFWRSTTGRYYFELVRAGLTPDPLNPVPPSERRQIEGGPP